MKIGEMRAMAVSEAKKQLQDLRTDLAKEKAVAAGGTRPENPGKIRGLRKNIARLLTVIKEKETAGKAEKEQRESKAKREKQAAEKSKKKNKRKTKGKRARKKAKAKKRKKRTGKVIKSRKKKKKITGKITRKKKKTGKKEVKKA